MKGIAKEPDLARYDAVIKVFQGMVEHRAKSPGTSTDALYYELVLDYHRRIRQAKEEGKLVAAIGTDVPIEILDAMDIVPMHLWWGSCQVVGALRNYEEAFEISQSYGLPSEICSVHRSLIAVHQRGWIARPDVVIWCTHTCENCHKIGEHIKGAWNIPGIYLDRPFGRISPQDVAYFAGELQELIQYLETLTGRRMDWDRLLDALACSQQMYSLEQEVYELKKSIPSPTFNRRIVQERGVRRLYAGTPQGVAFYRALRDELKAAVLTGQNMPPREDFRLLSLFLYGFPNRKVADWLQMEEGACLVAAPFDCRWAPWEANFSQPLPSLVRFYYAEPTTWTIMGPVANAVESAVADAREFGVDGAIWWAHRSCKGSCSIIKIVTDALRERLGLTTQVVDMDVWDPSYTSHEAMKESLLGYLESLAGRK